MPRGVVYKFNVIVYVRLVVDAFVKYSSEEVFECQDVQITQTSVVVAVVALKTRLVSAFAHDAGLEAVTSG